MTNAAGCSGVVTYLDYITVIAQPIAAFTYSPTQVDVTDTEVQFTNQSLYATSYTWDFGDGAAISNAEHPIHVFPETGNVKYTVILTATNELGCVDVVQKVIEVKDVLIYYIPNTFTPDGDTFNETFSPIFYSGVDIFDYHFTVFNRWGEMIFESYNPTTGWNGTYGDQGLVREGTYIWTIEYGETMSDKLHQQTGHVTILK
jgi:gliding motility-associated-like protein